MPPSPVQGPPVKVVHIPDAGDGRLDDYRRLNDVRWRKRYETTAATFIAEGLIVLQRVIEAGLEVRSVLCLDDRSDRLRVDGDVAVYSVSRETMRHVIGFDLHRGIVASVSRPEEPGMAAAVGHRAVAVLEGINDHQNLGAVVRAAAGLGVGAVVLDPSCADPWYRRSVRVSMGTVGMLPMIRAAAWPSAVDELAGLGYTTVALSPRAGGVPIFDLDLPRPAFILGAEGAGLSTPILERAQVIADIPMSNRIDSLNVGQAAAIAFAWG